MTFQSTIPQLRQLYVKSWQQRLFDWCEANEVIDVDAYRGNTNEWTLAWPPELDAVDGIIRNIHLYDVHGRFEAYSGIFTGRNVVPEKAGMGPLQEFDEEEMEQALASLKEYADGLDESHLVSLNDAVRDYLLENRAPAIIRSYIGSNPDESQAP